MAKRWTRWWTEEYPHQDTTKQYLDDQDPLSDHGGVPVGAILMPVKQTGRLLENFTLNVGKKMKYRGMMKLSDGNIIIHLPPEAVCYIEEDNKAEQNVQTLLNDVGGRFYGGVRPMDMTSYRHSPTTSDNGFSFAEVFAGIGGFRLALEKLGGHCCFASEIDGNAVNTYRSNWVCQDGEVIGDIRFPCQPFSTRGTKEGLDSSKGQLYKELIRLLRAKQPKCFLFENVVGLVTDRGGTRPSRRKRKSEDAAAEDTNGEFVAGSTFSQLLDEFAAEGYEVTWRVLNARHWLSQYRERVYIVGTRKDLSQISMDWSDIAPPGCGDGIDLRACIETSESELDAAELTEAQWQVVKAQLEGCGAAGGWDSRAIKLDGKVPTLISGYHSASNFSTKFVFENADGSQRDGSQMRPRFLTPRECARVMGFPDSFRIVNGQSEEGRGLFYHQIGNAVCPPVIHAVAQRLLRTVQLCF